MTSSNSSRTFILPKPSQAIVRASVASKETAKGKRKAKGKDSACGLYSLVKAGTIYQVVLMSNGKVLVGGCVGYCEEWLANNSIIA